MRKKLFAFLMSLTLIISLTAIPAAALSTEDAKQLLLEYYVDKIPEDVLSLDSLDEILAALGDPYTVYMSAEEYQQFLSSVNGDTVVGIGVSIQPAFDNGYKIMSILPNSPAQEAGLKAGDHIIAVDGTTLTDGMEVRSLIAGEAGTSVTITVIRQSDGQQKDYTMTRRSVVIPIVTYDTVDGAGVIDCI
ncbi:MAG: PDZ domain-containing protein, partial [Lawsonibacter sp.]